MEEPLDMAESFNSPFAASLASTNKPFNQYSVLSICEHLCLITFHYSEISSHADDKKMSDGRGPVFL